MSLYFNVFLGKLGISHEKANITSNKRYDQSLSIIEIYITVSCIKGVKVFLQMRNFLFLHPIFKGFLHLIPLNESFQ